MLQLSDPKIGEFTATINHLALWYKVSGVGPVCIHPTPGWGPSSELYFTDFAPLEEMFTMVYLDTRGSGRSQRPASNDYKMSDFVEDLEGLRRHLSLEKMWLMGHSQGGTMVLNYAFTHPDRVMGMILVDAPVGDTSKNEERLKRMYLREGEPWFEEAMNQWHKQPQTQEEFDAYMKTIMPFFFFSMENLERRQEVFDRTTLSFQALQGQQHSESDYLVSRLSELNIPTLILVGNDDFVCPPAAAQFLHCEIPHSSLFVIENAGHFPWLEQPAVFFESIRQFFEEFQFAIHMDG